jgi:hypothetical protein
MHGKWPFLDREKYTQRCKCWTGRSSSRSHGWAPTPDLDGSAPTTLLPKAHACNNTVILTTGAGCCTSGNDRETSSSAYLRSVYAVRAVSYPARCSGDRRILQFRPGTIDPARVVDVLHTVGSYSNTVIVYGWVMMIPANTSNMRYHIRCYVWRVQTAWDKKIGTFPYGRYGQDFPTVYTFLFRRDKSSPVLYTNDSIPCLKYLYTWVSNRSTVQLLHARMSNAYIYSSQKMCYHRTSTTLRALILHAEYMCQIIVNWWLVTLQYCSVDMARNQKLCILCTIPSLNHERYIYRMMTRCHSRAN